MPEKQQSASLTLREANTLEAVKITETEVFGLNVGLYPSFQAALAHFGADRKLSFDENYVGYLIFWHSAEPEVNYLTGGRILLEKALHSFSNESRYYIRNGRQVKVEGGNLLYV